MTLTVRSATKEDGPALGRMGAALARWHHDVDPRRFMLPDGIEEGYERWLLHEAENPQAVVVVAAREDTVVGYAYGRMEGRDWNRLLDSHGELHDVWVDESARGAGAGKLLVDEVTRRLAALGAPRVLLGTATSNQAAQRLFVRCGFRPTMIEMTRELED